VQLQLDHGVRGAKAPDDLGQHAVQRGGDEADRQAALDLADPLGHRGQLGGLGQQLAGMRVEEAAGLGELERPAAALEQQHPQVILQLLDLPGQRRLGDVQALGRAREVQLLGDGNEVTQVTQFHVDTRQV